MRRLAISSLALLSFSAGKQPGDTEGFVRREVLEVLDRQVEAWNRKDIEGFMQGYVHSDELTFVGSGGLIRGYEALERRYRRDYGPEKMDRLEFRDLDVQVLCADAALVIGRYHLEGKGRAREGIFSLVLRKRQEGFRIVHDHTSALPAPPPG